MKRSAGRWIVAVLALVFIVPLCSGLVAQTIGQFVDAWDEPTPTAAAPSVRPLPAGPSPSPTLTAASSTVDAGPAAFGLPVGTAVAFTSSAGTWTVAVLGVEWLVCWTWDGQVEPIVQVTVRYDVIEGETSVVPFADFHFVADGVRHPQGELLGCGGAGQEYQVLTEGQAEVYEVVFHLPVGTTGLVTYGRSVEPTASWEMTFA